MDEDAFDAIYKNSADSIYYTALRYCGNHHVAQEITQTVFMKLLEDLGGVEEKAVVSWLLISAKHMAINYKRGLEREVLYGDLLYEESEEFVSDYDLEEDFIRRLYKEECRELTENIFADLYHLNPRWYYALTITYYLGKPQKEVAEIMGMKIGTLHSVLHRAKKWIRKNYEEQFNHLHEK